MSEDIDALVLEVRIVQVSVSIRLHQPEACGVIGDVRPAGRDREGERAECRRLAVSDLVPQVDFPRWVRAGLEVAVAVEVAAGDRWPGHAFIPDPIAGNDDGSGCARIVFGADRQTLLAWRERDPVRPDIARVARLRVDRGHRHPIWAGYNDMGIERSRDTRAADLPQTILMEGRPDDGAL